MVCYICGMPSVLKCRECGKPVCGYHYDYSDGKCTVCHDKQFAKPESDLAAAAVETKPANVVETKPMLPKSRKDRV